MRLYWGGAAVVRLIGTPLLTRVPAQRFLAIFDAIKAALCVIVISIAGELAGYAALSIGALQPRDVPSDILPNA